MRTPTLANKTLKLTAAQKMKAACKRAAALRRREQALRDDRSKALSDDRSGGVKPAVISVLEFRLLTGLSRATVSRWVKSGRLRSTRAGGRRLIDAREIEKLRAK